MYEANKEVRKLTSEHVNLKFHNLGDDDSSKLVVFSDTFMGNLSDGGTQEGHLILLMGKEGRFSPVCRQSKGEGEWFGAHWQEKHLLLLMGLILSYFCLPSILNSGKVTQDILPVTCVTDNYSLADAVKSTKLVMEKQLNFGNKWHQKIIQSRGIRHILWSATKEQLADCLTKKGASALLLLRALKDVQWKFEK